MTNPTPTYASVTLQGPLNLDSWTTATRPTTPAVGSTGLNTTLGQNETWNGTAWTSGGAVASVVGNTGAVTLSELVAGGVAPLASPTLTGTPTSTTPATSDNSTAVATTAYVTAKVASVTAGVSTVNGRSGAVTLALSDIPGAAPLASPTFTGSPASVTPAVDDNDTSIATTAYVQGQGASANPVANGTAAAGVSTRWARADHVHPTDTSRAPLASPALTGAPTAPTATAGTNTTQVATTAFTTAAIAAETTRAETAEALLAPKASPAFTGAVTVGGASVVTGPTGTAVSTAMAPVVAATTIPAAVDLLLNNQSVPNGTSMLFAEAGMQSSDLTVMSAMVGVAGHLGANGLMGITVNDTTVGTQDFPTGVTGYGVLRSAGGQAFGLFGRADLDTAGTALNELDSFNNAGTPSGALPPNLGFGTTDYNAIPLLLAAYGNYASSLGMCIARGSQPFQNGIYIAPSAYQNAGLWIDSDTNSSNASAWGAVIKNYGTGINLQLVTTGPMASADAVINVVDATTTSHFSVKQNGDVLANNISPANILGTTTNGNALAGCVGEYLTNTTSGTSMNSGVNANATTLSLTAGDWDVEGVVAFTLAATTNLTSFFTGISTTSATGGAFGTYTAQSVNVTGQTQTVAAPVVRISLASAATVYLVVEAGFSVSTLTANGFIRARRVR